MRSEFGSLRVRHVFDLGYLLPSKRDVDLAEVDDLDSSVDRFT